MFLKLIYRFHRYIIEKRRCHQYRVILNRYGINHANRIKTFTSTEELRTLYSLALKIKKRGQGLEIGSYLGASTCYIVAGLAQKDAHLTCVDTWNNETMPDGMHDTYTEFVSNTQSISEFITTIRKNSLDLTRNDFSCLFDFVFIDGDHSYQAVNSDFSLIEKITSPQAIVIFHDVLYFEGVSRTIGNALASGHWGIGGLVQNLLWLVKK